MKIEDAILSSKIRSSDNDIGAININEVKLKISHINNRVYVEIKTNENENSSVIFLLDSGADISLIKLSDAERLFPKQSIKNININKLSPVNAANGSDIGIIGVIQ